MKKRTRTILFIVCLILFALAAPSMILYSQGFRFDFNPPANGKRIVQTGGFYFKVLPGSVNIYLNGKLKAETSIITNSSLIQNLLPKTYHIEIRKDGYHIWRKNLEVKEAQVTEAKNIILFPEKPNFTIINDPMPEIKPNTTSSDKNKVIEANDYEISVFFPEKEEKIFLTRFSEKICQIFWLNDYYLIFTVGEKIRTSSPDGSENLVFSPCSKIKIVEIDDRDKLNIIDLAEFENPEIFWSQNDKKLYVLSQGSVYSSENLLK